MSSSKSSAAGIRFATHDYCINSDLRVYQRRASARTLQRGVNNSVFYCRFPPDSVGWSVSTTASLRMGAYLEATLFEEAQLYAQREFEEVVDE
jgi:hypothetical protein